MQKQAYDYYQGQAKRKVLNTLFWYGLIHKKRKNRLNQMAIIQFKRRIVSRWIGVLNSI